jgi:hypothetical protein
VNRHIKPDFIMKTSKLTSQLLALIVILTLALTPAARSDDAKAPPAQPNNLLAPPAVDPAPGLPVGKDLPWKDPNWKESGKSIDTIVYDNLPLPEVAHDLRTRFKDDFDIILPNTSEAFPNGLPTISLQLKNVTASEIFNAMNLSFETDNIPLSWSLVMNGKRSTAVLRTVPSASTPPPAKPQRAVIFVGEILGDEKSGRISMEQLVQTLSDIYQMAYNQPQHFIQFHKEAQVLVITGTVDQINFVRQTLVELSRKGPLDRQRNAQNKADGSKTNGF